METRSFDRLKRDLRPDTSGWAVAVRHEAQAESVSGAELEQSSQGRQATRKHERLAEDFGVAGEDN